MGWLTRDHNFVYIGLGLGFHSRGGTIPSSRVRSEWVLTWVGGGEGRGAKDCLVAEVRYG